MKNRYKNEKATLEFERLLSSPEEIPLRFSFGDVECTLSSPCIKLIGQSRLDTEKKRCTEFYFSLSGGVRITVVLSHYESHGVTEWCAYFENVSTESSKIISDVEAVYEIEGGSPILKGILGDRGAYYTPYEKNLEEEAVNFVSDSGRATHGSFPYFNLECGDGGVMLAIGWAGTWRADFTYNGERTEYRASSVINLKSYLKPGEKIRSALFVYAPYTKRDEAYAANLWRSWFIECNLPKKDNTGAPLEPFSTCCIAHDTGRPNSDGSISETFETWRPSLEKMIAEGLKVDYRWVDAGWYSAPDGSSPVPFVIGKDWWYTIGSWELDRTKWPGKTFLESTDFARANGMKTLVWFEPERVTDPESLVKNYGYRREWAINIAEGAKTESRWVEKGRTVYTNNIGNPDCFKWTAERIAKMLRENKVELYREDNNSAPAPLWEYLDGVEGEGRRGITECKFIMAHYALWDFLIETTLSYGGSGFCDSCAAGGGRNDLESLRRGVPMLRSDSDRTTTARRLSITSTFNKWIANSNLNRTRLMPYKSALFLKFSLAKSALCFAPLS